MNYLEFHNSKQKMNLEKVNNLIFQVNFDFFFMNGRGERPRFVEENL